MTPIAVALFAATALGQSAQSQPPVDAPPHDITMVDPAPLGGAISVPLPEAQRRKLKRYDLPELAGARQALGSQLIDGNLPKPLIELMAVESTVRQRISIFEGGLVVVDVSGAGGTIRKKVIIPDDALKSYRKSTTAEALRRIRQESLIAPASGRSATLRVYDEKGQALERSFDPAAMLPKGVNDQVAPLQDLLRAIYEDRGVTNTVANYTPKMGDELVDDSRRVWRVSRVMNDKIVVLDCETDPNTIYVDVHDLYNYFIGKKGAAAR